MQGINLKSENGSTTTIVVSAILILATLGFILASITSSTSTTQILELEEFPGRTHYLRGNDPGERYTAVPAYAKVMFRDVYSGMTPLFYGNQEELQSWPYCPLCSIDIQSLLLVDCQKT